MGKERMIERICCNRVRMASGEESEPPYHCGRRFWKVQGVRRGMEGMEFLEDLRISRREKAVRL